MKDRLFKILFLSMFCVIVSDAAAEWTTGKYAGAFMETGVGARVLGMGGAGVATADDATAIYWNPAALTSLKNLQCHGMHSERFAGIVNWDFIGVGLPLDGNTALGFGFFRLGIDGIPKTALRDPSRPLDDRADGILNDVYAEEIWDDSEMAFVFSFARRKSDFFSYGANVKVIRKTVGDYGAWGLGFDVGVLMKPYRSLRLGMVLLDGTSTLVAWGGGRKEIITPQLKTGVAYPFHWSMLTFLPALDVQMHFVSRGATEQLSLGSLQFAMQGGLEMTYRDRLSFRVGMDRGRLTVGSGFRISAISLDYGFSHHLDLGHTHRISIGLNWDKTRLTSF